VVTAPMSVTLVYTVGGDSGQQTLTFTDSLSQKVVLDSVPVTADGSAVVNDSVSGLSDSTNWNAPSECVPVIPTPDPTVNPDPTNSAGGGGDDGPGGDGTGGDGSGPGSNGTYGG